MTTYLAKVTCGSKVAPTMRFAYRYDLEQKPDIEKAGVEI
jgi:hypothetical protein